MTTPHARIAPCNLGDCVTVDITPDGVTVGDTKTDGTLWFDHAEWAAFLAGVRAGEFDVPAGKDGPAAAPTLASDPCGDTETACPHCGDCACTRCRLDAEIHAATYGPVAAALETSDSTGEATPDAR